MIRRRIYPNIVSFRIMIDALCKEGELRKNVDTLDRIMGKRGSHSPSTIVNCSSVLRILEKGHVEEGEEDTVVVLLKRLLQKNLIIDAVAYSLVIHAKVTLGNLDSAWELYEEMVRRGFHGNSFVYTSFIGGFCRDGRIEEAIGLLREVEGKGLKPYGETFEHVIVGFADSERLEECLSVFEMLSVGFVPGCLVFNKVVEKMCQKGKVEQANAMLTMLLDKGFLPNDVTYFRLMQGYAKKDEVPEVLKLYYEMEYRSMSPGLSVFATIIWSLCRCGKVEDAEKYVSIMKGCFLTPDVTVYKALVAGYVKKGDSARALQFHNELASLGLALSEDFAATPAMQENRSVICASRVVPSLVGLTCLLCAVPTSCCFVFSTVSLCSILAFYIYLLALLLHYVWCLLVFFVAWLKNESKQKMTEVDIT
ncbi:hypothetical protein VNO77_42032 [Canavalia gladiata]|uniref:Pentatricopeptide repeat-containing protein n=1 Tax=Canavalia gladiata TaxID=3824 RepID=A0AAN9K0B0_CANGL